MARIRQRVAAVRAQIAQRKDAGVADPAIVMITIVVLVVLALGGMYIGRGFVTQARDTNAQSDLARVAASEEFYAASASGYTNDITALKTGSVSFNTSKGVTIDIAANATGWVASATDKDSGNVFYRASDSSDTYQVGPGNPFSALPAAPSGLAWTDVQVTK